MNRITAIISKIAEINCSSETFFKALFTPKLWIAISPVKKFEAEFVSPNVLYSELVDEVKLINFPIEMKGELVLIDKGEQEGKGRLVEFNVRNNKDVKELEGNLRIKALSENKSKIGIFIHKFSITSEFLNLIGTGVGELILRMKITDMARKLEKICKSQNLNDFI